MFRGMLLLGLAGLCLGAADDPDAVLARLRARIADDLRHMPNYTCVESVRREYFRPSVANSAASCDARGGVRAGSLQPWSVDQLRLDVAVTPVREVYSWAGAREFEERELTEIVGGGPISTGEFAAFLSGIFGSRDVEILYGGEIEEAGRPLMKFAYRVARDQSRYRIRAGSGWVITGYEGEIVADPVAADLVRLTVRTGELPSSTGSCETRTQMEYQRVVIGEMDLLLPATTRQRFVMRNGAEGENTSMFSSCREYRGQSTLRFLEESETETASVSGVPERAGGLPGNLPVRLDLAAPLDTWTASGGEMIVLRLAKPIVGAAKQVLVPAGAAIQARVMRVQRFFTKPERVTVVVAPETIERAGAQLPFAVRPARFAELHFVGDHVVLPKGYHTTWRTAAIANP